MISPRHHQNIRKRIHSKNEKYPHPKSWIKWFDRFIIVAGVGTVIATVPQVLEIWVNQSADSVSTISWAYYTFYALIFTVYGIIHKEFPIIFNYSIASVLYVMIVVGSVIY